MRASSWERSVCLNAPVRPQRMVILWYEVERALVISCGFAV